MINDSTVRHGVKAKLEAGNVEKKFKEQYSRRFVGEKLIFTADPERIIGSVSADDRHELMLARYTVDIRCCSVCPSVSDGRN